MHATARKAASGGTAWQSRNRSAGEPSPRRTARPPPTSTPDQAQPDPGEQVDRRAARSPSQRLGPELRPARRPAPLEGERGPAVRRVPGDHRREDGQADDRGQVRPGLPQDPPRRGLDDQVEDGPGRQEDRVVLAEHRPAPGQADADPGPSRLRGSSNADGQAVERQQPEEQERAVGQGERPGRRRVVGRRRSGRRPPADPARSPKNRAASRAISQVEPAKSATNPSRSASGEDVDPPVSQQAGRLDHRQHRRVVEVAPVAGGPRTGSGTPRRSSARGSRPRPAGAASRRRSTPRASAWPSSLNSRSAGPAAPPRSPAILAIPRPLAMPIEGAIGAGE